MRTLLSSLPMRTGGCFREEPTAEGALEGQCSQAGRAPREGGMERELRRARKPPPRTELQLMGSL